MSLVLSYLPQPELRAAMIRKARDLLREPGLLLIHDPPALDSRTDSEVPGAHAKIYHYT